MILTDTQIAVVEQQTGATPIPQDEPVAEQLRQAFGDHTFYADPNGLHVIEVLPEHMEGTEPGMAAIVQVAEWVDEEKSSLSPIEPKALGAVVNIDEEGEPAADAPAKEAPAEEA